MYSRPYHEVLRSILPGIWTLMPLLSRRGSVEPFFLPEAVEQKGLLWALYAPPVRFLCAVCGLSAEPVYGLCGASVWPPWAFMDLLSRPLRGLVSGPLWGLYGASMGPLWGLCGGLYGAYMEPLLGLYLVYASALFFAGGLHTTGGLICEFRIYATFVCTLVFC